MGLKLIKQGTQIGPSKNYEYINLGTNNTNRAYLATNTTNMEEDLNTIRSLIVDITGEEEFSDLPKINLNDLNEIARAHTALFHHDKDEVIEFVFDDEGTLTMINTFNNDLSDDTTILYSTIKFSFNNDDLETIEKIIFSLDGEEIMQHLIKTLVYNSSGDLLKIINEKIV